VSLTCNLLGNYLGFLLTDLPFLRPFECWPAPYSFIQRGRDVPFVDKLKVETALARNW